MQEGRTARCKRGMHPCLKGCPASMLVAVLLSLLICFMQVLDHTAPPAKGRACA